MGICQAALLGRSGRGWQKGMSFMEQNTAKALQWDKMVLKTPSSGS